MDMKYYIQLSLATFFEDAI